MPSQEKNPNALIQKISEHTESLALRLNAHPEWIEEIGKSKFIRKRKPKKTIGAELNKSLGDGTSASLVDDLRRFKYRELTRLVARDISGNIDTKEMLEEWSDVADSLIETVYANARRILCDKHGVTPCPGTIIALGKLGARELNLSSDIDLLFLYESDDEQPTGLISNHEFYVQLAVEFSKLCSEVTPEGFLFRVDHELRPEGTQGTLANSIDAAERYYQYFGDDWERQMLIRARPVAGDFKLGQKFITAVEPFIYRRSVSLGDLTHMRDMKLRMENDAKKRTGSFDLKHGPGGIREVEFFVQALQQLYGGRRPSIRHQNTYDAIAALKKESLIHPHVAKTLADAYSFLRRTENMIQAENDLQTHRLPANKESFLKLARRMGFDSDAEKKLTADLEQHTINVERFFHALFEADYERQELEEAIRANLVSCKDEEERTDSLAWFRQQESNRIWHLDLHEKVALPNILRRLTLVAEAIIRCSWEIAFEELTTKHGSPLSEDGKPAHFAIVGMGKLGSQEMDYGSDVDLLFLYSTSGRTDGKRAISNVEFFTKLAQRIISQISLPTRYGRAYIVDSELRPSGHSGALVATLGSFEGYHSQESQVWERLSLLRARVIAGNPDFSVNVSETLKKIAFEMAPPPAGTAISEISALRQRTLEERSRESKGVIDLKLGSGGAADLDTMIQFHHLMNAFAHESLHQQNTFVIVDALYNEGLIDEELYGELMDHLLFYRRLISRLRITAGRQNNSISEDADYINHLTGLMEFDSPEKLLEEINKRRDQVRELYSVILSGSEESR